MPVVIDIDLHVWVAGYSLSRPDAISKASTPELYVDKDPPRKLALLPLKRLHEKADKSPEEVAEMANLENLARYYAAGRIADAANWWSEELAKLEFFVCFRIVSVELHYGEFELDDSNGAKDPDDNVYTYRQWFTSHPGISATQFTLHFVPHGFLNDFGDHDDPGAGAVNFETLFSGVVHAKAKRAKVAHELGHVIGIGHPKTTTGIMNSGGDDEWLPTDKEPRRGHKTLAGILTRRHGEQVRRGPSCGPCELAFR